ncbi:MAG: TIGR02391 family protein [Pyrinomonadaceae bacterium]|nr:TIGR02391 family protein [Pyrinomonadaceae bacterium]
MTKEEALGKLQKVIDEIAALQRMPRKSPEFEKWQRDTRVTIERIFPDQPNHLHDFDSVSYSLGVIRRSDFRGRGGTSEAEFQTAYVNGLDKARAILQSMSDEVQDYWKNESAASMLLATDSGGLWDLIHPKIAEVARSRFESNHLADAVEASLKKVNAVVKAKVRNATGKELDGSGLMTTAFSVQNPVIELDDLGIESGKSIQQGYMQIFAGAMTGIRNPKAHDNINIDEKRAIHLLFLASLLMYKLDEAR